jgi:hypothetical protein
VIEVDDTLARALQFMPLLADAVSLSGRAALAFGDAS